jgi:hypothetical protein
MMLRLLFCLNIVLGNISLQYIPISFNQTIKVRCAITDLHTGLKLTKGTGRGTGLHCNRADQYAALVGLLLTFHSCTGKAASA